MSFVRHRPVFIGRISGESVAAVWTATDDERRLARMVLDSISEEGAVVSECGWVSTRLHPDVSDESASGVLSGFGDAELPGTIDPRAAAYYLGAPALARLMDGHDTSEPAERELLLNDLGRSVL